MDTGERRQQLKKALTAAAERVIADRGLTALRAREIAEEVGCALGAIYTVFPDLDTLIFTVNSRTLAMLDQALGGPRRRKDFQTEPGDSPAVTSLVQLALNYLEFAAAHRLRWRALFEHRMAEGSPIPEFHLSEQTRLFAYVEEPLRTLRPELEAGERVLLARSLFSAVHGIVSLGLEEKLVAMPLPALRRQLAVIVRAAARGL